MSFWTVRRKVFVLACGMSLLTGGALAAPPPKPAAVHPSGETGNLPWEQVRLLADVMQLVKDEYVVPVDDKTLIQGAIRGLLTGLDPHSDFLDKSEFSDMQTLTTGEFNGLGIEIGVQDDDIVVIAPIDDTPASRAGIRAGDQILEVNGTSLDGLTLDQVAELLRGKPGTTVTLKLLAPDSDTPRDVTLTRAVIRMSSVHARLLEPGYGYLRISDFGDDTAPGVITALRTLVRQNGGALRGVVMDLRDNPGGLLDAAVDVSDDFLDSGEIVSAKGRAADANFVRRATAGDLLQGAPLVVLVDGGTASAAEIVAGALQDNRRALVMGTQTFGKGSVQTVIPLPGGDAIKLTTALYYTPSGHSIQAQGIVPDVEVQPLTVSAGAGEGDTLKEANLSGHFRNAAPAPATVAGSPGDLPSQDFQLYQALNMLKGLSVAGHRSPG